MKSLNITPSACNAVSQVISLLAEWVPVHVIILMAYLFVALNSNAYSAGEARRGMLITSAQAGAN